MSTHPCPTGEHRDDWCCERCDHGDAGAECICGELRENAEGLVETFRNFLTTGGIKQSEKP